jgi:hypothetical protein
VKKIFRKVLYYLAICCAKVNRCDNDQDVIAFYINTFENKIRSIISTIVGIKKINYVPKSNKVYILASGASISKITDSEWLEISCHDIFSVNLSTIHGVNVDLSFWELLSSDKLNRLFINSVSEKKSTRVCVNLNHALGDKRFYSSYLPELKKIGSVFGFKCINLKLERPEQDSFKTLIDNATKLGCDEIIHHCTHIGAVVDFAVKSGFEEIVLLGCDLNGSKYFSEVKSDSNQYQKNKYYDDYNSYREAELKIKGVKNGDVHPTMVKEIANSFGSLTAVDYFEIINEIYTNKGVKLKVYDRVSTLSQYLDYELDRNIVKGN